MVRQNAAHGMHAVGGRDHRVEENSIPLLNNGFWGFGDRGTAHVLRREQLSPLPKEFKTDCAEFFKRTIRTLRGLPERKQKPRHLGIEESIWPGGKQTLS